ncbi:MAG: Trigger factor [Legionellaceae bacterium]
MPIMQVSVETISGLQKKISVTISAEEYVEKYNNGIKKTAKKARVDGFRPGKVPEKIVISQYGESIQQEALNEVIRDTFKKAIEQEKLELASSPHFEQKESVLGEPVEYTATFEVYPTIELKSLDNVEIEKTVSQITEEDIDKVIEDVRRQRMTWTTVDRAAKEQDKVTIDFHGMMDGSPLERGSAENANVIIGSKSMIPGFEEGLIDKKKGDEFKLSLVFPEDYHVKEIAGKSVEFDIKMREVAEGILPPADETLAQALNVKNGIEGLRQEVRQTLEQNLEINISNRFKRDLFNKYLVLNPIEIPNSLVKAEVSALLQEIFKQNQSPEFNKQMPDFQKLQEEAERRVRLGLVMQEVIKSYSIKVDMDKVAEEIKKIAKAYENPEEVIAWYNKNPDQLQKIQALVIEEQVIDKLLENAKVVEKSVSYNEIISTAV